MLRAAFSLSALALFATRAMAASNNPKRGLCFIADSDHPEDNEIWAQPETNMSWYYNYGDRPSPSFSDLSQSEFEFIPMMWGIDSEDVESTSFRDTVRELIDDGRNITRVMGFNEPDASWEVGGSDIPPSDAARAWVANFVPLSQDDGIEVGLPAMTGAPSGLEWLQQFLGNCSELVSTGSQERNCTFDFLPVHWYDNFEGLASHIGERLSLWPNTSIWITEYAYAHQDLRPTQEFYETTIDYFERLDEIGGYSYFGAFRSEDSNVGPNAPFLNNDGELTDIGAWYLGEEAKGIDPQSGHSMVVVAPMTAALAVSVASIALAVAF